MHKLENNKGKDSGILWPFVVKWRRRASVLLKQGCFRTLPVMQNFSYWTRVTSIFSPRVECINRWWTWYTEIFPRPRDSSKVFHVNVVSFNGMNPTVVYFWSHITKIILSDSIKTETCIQLFYVYRFLWSAFVGVFRVIYVVSMVNYWGWAELSPSIGDF